MASDRHQDYPERHLRISEDDIMHIKIALTALLLLAAAASAQESYQFALPLGNLSFDLPDGYKADVTQSGNLVIVNNTTTLESGHISAVQEDDSQPMTEEAIKAEWNNTVSSLKAETITGHYQTLWMNNKTDLVAYGDITWRDGSILELKMQDANGNQKTDHIIVILSKLDPIASGTILQTVDLKA
jgi:hypothetical protein